MAGSISKTMPAKPPINQTLLSTPSDRWTARGNSKQVIPTAPYFAGFSCT